MDVYEMAHRWCNCDFGKKGSYRAGRASCDENRFYSYDTTYAMWLDKTPGNKLMLIMNHACSRTSNTHLGAIRQAIPDNVKYISTHLPGTYYERSNVNFSGCDWQMQLPFALLKDIQDAIKLFKESQTIGTRSNLNVIQRLADDINWLFDNRKDCKVKEMADFLKKRDKNELKKIFGFVRKKCTPEELVDKILGSGTYAAYEERLAPQKKAERTRKFIAWFNRTHGNPKTPYTKKDIQKMSISDKVRLACMPPLQQWEKDNNDWYISNQRDKRLVSYLGCDEIAYNCGFNQTLGYVVVNRFTGERYEFTNLYSDGMYWYLNKDSQNFSSNLLYRKGYGIPFINLREYKKLKNKDQWLKRFYQKCAIISKRHEELKLWMKMQSYTDDELNQCSEESLAKFNRVQLKFAAFMADQEAKRLAQEAERKRMEEEKIRLEQERKMKYDSYVARGIEGYRALYYENLDTISVSRSFDDEFFFGGNVLLRWRTEELIETSKNILITIPQAKKFFKVITQWHNDPKKFKRYTFNTKSGNYDADKYENDILTAGCHKIAYCEMERMYNEILKRESA